MSFKIRSVAIVAISAAACFTLSSCGSDDKTEADSPQTTSVTTPAAPTSGSASDTENPPTSPSSTGGSSAAPTATSTGGAKPSDKANPSGKPDSSGPDSKPAPAVTTTGKPQLGPTEAVERKTAAPVPVDKEQDFGTGVSAKISDVSAIDMKNVRPGEIKGPAAKFKVTFTNKSDKAIDLSTTTVTLNYDGMEASAFSSEPAQEPPASLAPGKSASGVYVFGVPKDKRDKVKIRVSYDASAPLAIFEGKLK